MRFAILIAIVAACGGGGHRAKAPRGPAQPDQFIELPEETLEGTYFEPAALAELDPGWKPTKRPPLTEQRKRYARAKGAARLPEADALAALLWSGDAQARQEAVQVLAESAPGGSADLVLKLAIAAEVTGDAERGDAAFSDLQARFGKDPQAARWRALRAYFHLRRHEDYQAQSLIEDLHGTAAASLGEVAYVRAWLLFRAGDLDGAKEAMILAANHWTDEASAPKVWQELMLVAARDGADVSPTVGLLQELAKKGDVVRALGHLADAYLYAGEYDRRGEVLEALAKDAAPDVLATIRYYESDVAYRMNRPAAAVAKLIDALGGIGTGERAEVAERMYELGAIYHRVYGTDYDAAFGEAAQKLFEAYLKLDPPGPQLADVQTRMANLSELRAGEATATARAARDADDVRLRVAAHHEEVAACYEHALQSEAKLAGKVSVSWDVDAGGAVVKVTTQPAAGEEGLPAVARCVVEKVKAWTFPKRKRTGTARMTAVFHLAKASA